AVLERGPQRPDRGRSLLVPPSEARSGGSRPRPQAAQVSRRPRLSPQPSSGALRRSSEGTLNRKASTMNTLEFASPPPRERRREPVSLPTDRLWTVRHAAAFLGRSESWVYKAAERGELPRARGMGWGLRFVPAELLAYARGETRQAHVAPVPKGGK